MFKEIITNGITLLLVEVPEYAINFRIDNYPILETVCEYEFTNNEAPELRCIPQGMYLILGKSTELSEEQIKGICEQVSFGNYTGYKNYQAKCCDFRDIVESSFSTVQQSYLSLLGANGIVDRNPYELPESGRDKLYDSSETHGRSQAYHEEWHKRIKQYQETKSKVKHYLVLEKL